MRYKCENCKSVLLTEDIGCAYFLNKLRIIRETDYDFSSVHWIEKGFNYCKKCYSEEISELEEV